MKASTAFSSNIITARQAMSKVQRFKPVLGMCSQGQRRGGVNEGGLYLYEKIFSEICHSKPYVVQHAQFDSQEGYLRLY